MNNDKRATLPADPQAAVCLHLTSLPGRYGIGELGSAAFEFIDTMNAMGLGVWQFLPTGPTAYGDSPYQPLSTFAGNPLLIDIAALERIGLLHAGESAELARLPRDLVDYGRLIPAKTDLLTLAANRFETVANSDLKSAFDDFMEANQSRWLRDYALFRVLKARHGGRAWPEWDTPFVRRDERVLRRLEGAAARELHVISVCEFLFHHQWQALRAYARERGVLLFGDMPIYIALDSADAWANGEILRIDRDGNPAYVAGVPPDYFSADGQLWGNPLYDWDYHRRTGFEWWIGRMRHSMTMMDLVRIDHFRGFEAYWAVPAEAATARDGAWEPGPRDAIFDAMRAALGDLPIVAEDLGAITAEVDELRYRQGIPGMNVLQFMAGEPDFDLASIQPESVCYTGTHDNDTTVGWFHGSDGDLRSPDEIAAAQRTVLANTGGTPETIHLDMIRLAFRSASRVAIAPMQDYLGCGSAGRLNTPGRPRNNWRWRLPADAITDEFCARIHAMVSEAGRAPQWHPHRLPAHGH